MSPPWVSVRSGTGLSKGKGGTNPATRRRSRPRIVCYVPRVVRKEAKAPSLEKAPGAPWIAALAILAGGVVLRCIGLGHREFWHDEYCSMLYATAPEGTLRALRVGGNPPLYFL